MKIVLINNIFPPDNGASGLVLNELYLDLASKGLHVVVVTTNQTYKSNDNDSELQYDKNVIRLELLKKKQKGLRRLYYSMIVAGKLLKKAISLQGDIYIVCTDPVFLPILAGYFLRRERWILWSMDLFPDGFEAAHILNRGGVLTSLFKKMITEFPPAANLFLGKNQMNYFQEKYYTSKKSMIVPCGLVNKQIGASVRPKWKIEDKIYIAYCGNLGRAHSARFIIELVKNSNPNIHQFTFSFHGEKEQSTIAAIGDQPNVKYVEWIETEDLKWFDVQIVTLLNEWTHICVPSKAITALQLGTPLIHCGSKDGDVYSFTKEANWHFDSNPEDWDFQEFYLSLTKASILIKKQAAFEKRKQIQHIYNKGVEELIEFLNESKIQ